MTNTAKLIMLRSYLTVGVFCPCCGENDVCEPACTFGEDHPQECEQMDSLREIFRQTVPSMETVVIGLGGIGL